MSQSPAPGPDPSPSSVAAAAAAYIRHPHPPSHHDTMLSIHPQDFQPQSYYHHSHPSPLSGFHPQQPPQAFHQQLPQQQQQQPQHHHHHQPLPPTHHSLSPLLPSQPQYQAAAQDFFFNAAPMSVGMSMGSLGIQTMTPASPTTSPASSRASHQPQPAQDASVAQALEIARESPDGASDPTISKILEAALADIWGKVQAQPDAYIMTRDEFAVFNFFQHRFVGDKTAVSARARYWDNFRA